MSLDEQTHGEDLDWGEVRSACAECDWRRAWKAVGTDQVGPATPGEAYILSAARRAWSVAPALRHWRAERDAVYDKHIKQRLKSAQAWREIAPLDKGEMWRRIKRLAGMESSAAAQHVSRAQPRGFSVITLNGKPIGMSAPGSPWAVPDTPLLEDMRQVLAQRGPMRGNLTMSLDTARALANHPDLRPLTQARAERADLNPNPRGPAQRKRRAR